jgi:hypothetical protein
MELLPRVVAVELIDGGLLLAFEDDVCAFYSASLLRLTLAQADLIDEAALEEE